MHQIDFKDDMELHAFPNLKHIGIELLQIKLGTLFNNILLSHDPEYGKKLAEETWGKHKNVEKEAFKAEEKKKNEEQVLSLMGPPFPRKLKHSELHGTSLLEKGNFNPSKIPLAHNLSNILHIATLYKYGGIYIDTDVRQLE
eukprot:Gb_20111 [translate_table: standard]